MTNINQKISIDSNTGDKMPRDCFQIESRQIMTKGVRIDEHQIHVSDDITLKSSHQEPLPGLLFMRKGLIETDLGYSGPAVSFYGGTHSLLYNPFSAESSVLRRQDNIQLVVVSFAPELFLCAAEMVGDPLSLPANSVGSSDPTHYTEHHNVATNGQMEYILDEILSCTFKAGLLDLFIQSKALELLSIHCSSAMKERKATHPSRMLSPADLGRITLAGEILRINWTNPPCLAALARETGLNEFKLKAGFRQVFNTTVYNYLNDYRLAKCRTMVQETRKGLAEIAYETGFSSPAHFSYAFRKKFGLSPSALR